MSAFQVEAFLEMLVAERGASANTIAKLDMSKTNVLTDVSGILSISWGVGPTTLLPSYDRYVAINVPNSRHSEPIKVQNAILRVSCPVLV